MLQISFRMRLLVGFLFAITVFAAGCSRSPLSRKTRYMESGRRYYDQKDYARAILDFRNATDVAQGDPEPSYRLGLAYLASGDVQSAAVSFSTAVGLNPKHVAAQLRLAELLTMGNDPELLQDALKRLKLVLDTAPSADALNALALTEIKLGNQQSAQQHLEEALARFPQDLSAYVVLAKSKLLRRDFEGAEATLKKAIEVSPRSPEAHVALGSFYTEFGRTKEGEALFREALALDKHNAPALFQLGLLEYNAGRKSEAEPIFRELSAFNDPTYKPMHAIFLFNIGDKKGAIAELESLTKSDPKNHRLRAQLVAAYWADRQLTKVGAVVDAAIKQNSKDFDALLQRGELYLAQGKYSLAQADLDQVMSYKRDSATVHYIMAKLRQARGSEIGYRQELAESLRLNPDSLQARLDLANAFIASNGAKSAVATLDEAPPAQKSSLEWLTARNWALLANNDYSGLRQGTKAGLALARTPDLLIQQAWVNLADQQYGEALLSIEEAQKQAPKDTRALQALVALYAAQKKTAELRKRLENYAEQSNSAEVRLFVGGWELREGNRDGARSFFRAAKLADPRFQEADVALALLDASEGRFDNARSLLAQLIATRDQDVALRLQSASLDMAALHYPQAIEQYRSVLNIDHNNIVALNNLAYLLASQSKADEALAYAQEAKEIAPDEAAVADTLGWVLYRKGLYSSAVSYLETAARKSTDPAIRYHLGMAYIKSGNQARGKEVLQTALKTAPDLPEAVEGRRLVDEVR